MPPGSRQRRLCAFTRVQACDRFADRAVAAANSDGGRECQVVWAMRPISPCDLVSLSRRRSHAQARSSDFIGSRSRGSCPPPDWRGSRASGFRSVRKRRRLNCLVAVITHFDGVGSSGLSIKRQPRCDCLFVPDTGRSARVTVAPTPSDDDASRNGDRAPAVMPAATAANGLLRRLRRLSRAVDGGLRNDDGACDDRHAAAQMPPVRATR